MPLIAGKSKKSFGQNVSKEMNSGKGQKQALAIAYSVQRKAKKKDPNYAEGGQCYSEGGEVENEKLRVAHSVPMASGMREDLEAMDDDSDDESGDDMLNRGGMVGQGRRDMAPMGVIQSHVGKYAEGGVVEDIMKERKAKRMAAGGLVDEELPLFQNRSDLEPVHYREDEEHDMEPASEDEHELFGQREEEETDDDSIVGAILRDRRSKRK